MTSVHKILIDTDIGNDIDDAYALAFALIHPQLEVLGISTVDHHVELRARLAQTIVKTTGKDIPVTIGAEGSPTKTRTPHLTTQLAWAAEHLSTATTYPLSSWEYFNQVAREHPGEITLVCLGQLTNVAIALDLYPSLKENLKGLAIMRGETVYFRREHNFANDYLAADRVISSGIETFLATWSVSKQLTLDEITRQRFKAKGGPMLELLLTLQDVWGYQPVLYDLSPLLWLIEPGIFQTVPMHLRVETVGMFTRGCLISLEKHATGLPIDECVPYGFSYQESPEVWVSQDMNVAQAKEVFVQTLLG